jgi:two-component system, OmpR family, phosphate regulon sensor histidine kinase PhoR
MVGLLGFLLGIAFSAVVLLLWQFRFGRRLEQLLKEEHPQKPWTFLYFPSAWLRAIARQRQSQQVLEREIELYRRILHASPVGYLQVDEENQVTWSNPMARQLLEIQQSDYRRPRLLLELVRSYELDQLIEQTRNTQQLCRQEWSFHAINADPQHLFPPRSCALRGYGLPLHRGHVGVFLENRQEIALLTQQRDRWVSDVAHELKTPLTSIRLVAETLQYRIDPALRHWLDRLLNEVVRLSNLVQDVLDLSQLERGTLHCLSIKSVNLPDLIHSAWLNLEPLARQKQVKLEYTGVAHLLIQADESRLYRVLLNLLDNSIKYSPEGQTIRVCLTEIQEAEADPANSAPSMRHRVHLEVIDAGPGFSEAALPYIFDRFFRADQGRARPANLKGDRALDPQICGGNGLGLAIVRQIIAAHHGSVTASNHPETGGAWLQVTLPCLSS